MKDFRNLDVWHKSHALALAVYKSTAILPKEELFCLSSQMRRSAASILANIAEGCGRGGGAELKHFLHIAMGSACELEYHVLLARDLGFIGSPLHEKLTAEIVEVKRMLSGLISKIRSDQNAH